MEHLHIEVIGESPNEINNEDADKNIDSNCAFNQLVNVIEKNGDQEHIDKVNKSKIPKLKVFQALWFLLI